MDISREWESERNVQGTFLVTKSICESSLNILLGALLEIPADICIASLYLDHLNAHQILSRLVKILASISKKLPDNI